MIDSNRPVLLVEDDEIDVMTVKRAVKDLNITNPLHIAGNGEEGLKYLEKHQSELPSIILLDINMPRMNGIEFLKQIKSHSDFKRIPVIILTTSKEEQDRYDSFNLSAAGYMLKPVDYTKFVELFRAIEVYWTLSEFST